MSVQELAATAPRPSSALSISNHPPSRLPGPCLLHELVSRQSSLGLPAISSLSKTGHQSDISYQDLHQAADRLAAQISALRGVPSKSGFVVPILIPQCTQLYIAILAILKAGGAFCPLNLDAPSERIKFILQDVGASIVLATPELVSRIPCDELGVSLITMTDATEPLLESPTLEVDLPHPEELAAENLAYVMYTSGSTGTPKGVGISHDAATQSLLAHERHIPSFQRFLQFASPTFDVSVFEILFPLFRGCTLVTCDRSSMLDDLPAVMRAMRVDACELTPTVAGSLLRTRASVPSLKLLLTIGEMLTPRVVEEFGGNTTSPSILWGMYGPTEAAIHCTLQTAFLAESSPRMIGIPFDTVSCFIVKIPTDSTDSTFNVAPIGDVGELVVGGFQLAKHYLNRPEQTNAAFIDSPYGRLYRTGDKAIMNPDGSLECIGRISEGQVKLRGQRIELGEVEQAAMRVPGCRDVVGMVIDNILVIFCIPEDDPSSVCAEKVLRTCSEWLPAFMVPGDVVIINEFPRLPSGKIDRHQMKRNYENARNTKRLDQRDDLDPLEAKIAAVVASLVGHPVTPSDNISAHGLDSLKAIQAASALRKEGVHATTLDVIGSKTITALCAKIRLADDTTGTQCQTRQPPDADCILSTSTTLRGMNSRVEGFDWCTPLQKAMLFETSVNSSLYLNSIELELPGSCSFDRAKSSLQQIIHDNDILRSGFIHDEAGIVRVVFKYLDESQIKFVDRFENLEQEDQSDYRNIWLQPFQAQIMASGNGAPSRLLLHMHHAIYDGWTIDLIIRDLSAILENRNPDLRPQFCEISALHVATSPTDLDTSRAFWAEHLIDWRKPALPRLLSRPPDSQAPKFTSRKLAITGSELSQAAGIVGCHPQVFFQAAVSWLWSATLGALDVVIGCVSSGRTLPIDGIDQIMGPCITSLPLRTNLETLRSVTDLLKSIQSTNRKFLQHGVLPLSEIQKLAGVQSGDTLYDLLFVYQESLFSHGRHTSPVREISHRDALETKALVEIEPTNNGTMCHLTYHADAMSSDYAELFLEQIDCIARHFLQNPTTLLSDVSSCVPTQLSSIYNPTPATLSGCPDLATNFERSASAAPGAQAICFAKSITATATDSEAVSYQKLNGMSNQVAWYLRSQGVGEGNIVAIIMEKSILLYVAILGTLKAGCAYLPLLPSTPPSRVRAILAQASVDACLVDQQAPAMSTGDTHCQTYNLQSVDLLTFPTDNLPRQIDGSRPAYIIYTSGTTGTPKGIVVTQLNITSNLDVLSRLYPSDNGSRFLQLCSQAFDVSVFEIFFAWTTGACLCAGSHDTLFNDLEHSIRSLRCTHLSLTPTVAALVSPCNVPKVEFLVTAGEPMSSAVSRSWGPYLFQGYGPAETTNICTVKKMKEGDYINHLGFAFENVSAFVLSTESTYVVPRGSFGEFCFGGDQVAEGYINLPEATDSKFIDHPAFGRMYRSGDMGRMLPDGSLLVAGRLDGQVKLRGQRIETGEIDSIVTSAEEVGSCASLILQPTDSASQQLVSFYTPSDNNSLYEKPLQFDAKLESLNQVLFAELTSLLPEYMIPSYLVPLVAIPLTSSGKVDKRKLRTLFDGLGKEELKFAAKAQTDRTDENDWSDTEHLVAQAVAQSLKVPQEFISRWQPLATLGLDSISAISVAKALESAVRRRIPISQIIQNPSVALLARIVEKGNSSDHPVEPQTNDVDFFSQEFTVQIAAQFAKQEQAILDILPCTPLQEAMLSSTNNSSYTNQLVLKLNISASAMSSHLQTIVDRHGILRTCFVTTADARHAIAQVILQQWEAPLTRSRHRNLQQGTEVCKEHVPTALNSQQPPYVLDLLHVDDDDYLVFTCHHALYDGESMRILLEEVEKLVRGVSLPPPVSYAPAIRQMLSTQGTSEEFWKDMFDGFNPAKRQLSLPQARHSSSSDSHLPLTPHTYTAHSEVSLDALQKAARNTNTSLLALGQAAWALLLSITRNQGDVCFGNVMSGRSLPLDGIDRLAAPCFNTVPIRIDINADMQITDLLARLHQLNSKLLDHQFSSLRSIPKLLPNFGQSLFDTILLLQPAKRRLDPTIWDLIGDTGGMDIPLVCELVPNTEHNLVEISLHTNSPSLDASTSSCLLQAFSHVLDRIVRHPATTVPTEEELPENLRRGLAEGFQQLRQQDVNNSASNASDRTTHSQAERPWSSDEVLVRKVLSRLSGVSETRIRHQTTIFQLGLDSINAVQIAALLRAQGLQASTIDVIECPSCDKLAQRFAASERDHHGNLTGYDVSAFQGAVSHTVEIRLSAQIEETLPCTPIQCGMMNDFIKSDGVDYLNYLAFELDNQISTERVVEAWSRLVQTHAILRTGFVPVDHADAAFAMVQYSTPEDIISELITQHDALFDLKDWKLECSRSVLNSLDLPPWRIAFATESQHIVLHLIIHHALYDAQSLNIILEDLTHLLNGSVLSPSSSSTRGAVATILGVALDDEPAKAFWQAKSSEAILNRFPTMTSLIEPSSTMFTEARRSRLSFATLRSLASSAGVSIQALLQAAWTRVLSAYLGEQAILFGVVLSGRTLPQTEDAMLPCITTVPVISHNQASNAELISQMMQYNSELLAHQYAPLSKIQHWLGHPGTRLFDTLLVYQKATSKSGSAPAFPWRQISDEGRLDYAVSLEVEPSHEGHIDLRLSSRTNILPQGQASFALGQFDTVLEDLATHPEDHDSLIWQLNPELASILPPRNVEIQSEEIFLHQFVETTARTHPTRLAIEFVSAFRGDVPESHGITFKELDDMGNRVANILAKHIQSRGIIAVHFDKCPEAFFAMLGILKAGCSFLALDPSAPKARKEFILEDSKALALMTAGDALDFEPVQTIIELNQQMLNDASNGRCFLGDGLSADDTCYCLYTSGTTGTPKGCEITHENAVQAMKAFQRLFAGHWNEDSRWLQFASFHFDVSVLEQYWSWSVAMPLIVVPRDLILDDIAATIRRLRITHLDLTPSLARLLDPKDVPTLCKGVFITGGEALKQEILDTWGPQGVIYNAYGPTEATIGVTMYQRVPQNGRASNIGRQFDNVGTYVFQPGTEIPVMRGAVGELCISGKLVGKGYLNRPELTIERFPVLEHFKEKIYRTGDLVRVLYDGCFEFLGRADDQVKLRGQRLEIGEINHAIRTGVTSVKDVVTLVTKHPKVDKDLLVTFVTSSEMATSTQKLEILTGSESAQLKQAVLKACRNKLPGYMVPSHVFEVPFIPLSINNKAEMKTLGHLFASLTPEFLLQVSASVSPNQGKPATKAHKTILAAVSKFFGLPVAEISLSSNLFDLGIDSISCLRLSRFLKQDGLVSATPAILLRNPVLDDLAEALQDGHDSNTSSAIRESQQHIQAFSHRARHEVRQRLSLSGGDEVEYIVPCTPLQEGMLSRTFTKVEESYFVAFQLRLDNRIDAERLRASWDKLVAHHPILRTRFVPTSGGFAQAALRQSRVAWTKYKENHTDVESILRKARSAWISRNQDMIIEPLECLLVDSAEGNLLVVHIFHALYDGISLGSMLQWLADDYLQKAHPAVPSFLDAVSCGPLQSFNGSRSFWVQHLSTCSFEPLRRIMTRNPTATHSVQRQYDVEKLRETSKALNVTLQSAVLALWSSTFGKHFSTRAAMGVVVSGRSIDVNKVEDIVGPLFNTLPFYADLTTNNTWQKLVQRCHDFNTSTLPFQHVPLRNIQKWCCDGRSIFDSLFVYQNETSPSPDEESMWMMEDSFVASDYPLAFEATATRSGALQVQVVVHGEAATENDLHRIFDEFEEAMFALSTGRAGTLRNPVFSLASQESSAGASPLTTRSASTDSAGHSTDVSAPEFTISNYEWTETALVLRTEISAQAQVPIEAVSENTSLLELGLDSIDLVSLSSRLKQKGLDITMSQLLRTQTITDMEKISVHSQESLRGDVEQTSLDLLIPQLWNAVEATGCDMGNVETVLPPTPLQESMIADMIDSDFQRYFNHDVMEISSGVAVDALVDAWLKVISHSPVLRTVFVQLDDPRLEQTFCQVILSHHLPSIRHLQLQEIEDIDSILKDHHENARQANGSAELLQLAVVHVQQQTYLVFSIAHVLYDGWSLALMHRDVEMAYGNTFVKRPSPKKALQQLLRAPSHDSQRFWSQYLAGAQPSLLPEIKSQPTDYGRHAEALASLSLPEVMSFCKNNSVSLQVLGQACWSSVLASRLSSLDVTFGVVLSGRDTEEAQRIMFPTMNTIALRCVLHGSALSFLRYLQDSMADIHEHQTFPLRKAQLAGKQTPGRLFNTLFLLQRQPEVDQASSHTAPLATSIRSSATTDFAVCIELEATTSQISWRIAGNETFVSEQDIKELLQQLDITMNHFVRRPNDSLLQFDGDRTSICQLPPFVTQLVNDNPDNVGSISETTAAEQADLPCSEAESIIRGVLSEVSGIPYEAIPRDSTPYHLGLDSISLIKVSSLLKRRNISLGVRSLLAASSLADMANLATHPAELQVTQDVQPTERIPEHIDIEKIRNSTSLSEFQIEEVLSALPMQVYMMTAWQKSGGQVFYPELCYRLEKSTSFDTLQQSWSSLVAAESILRTCLVPTGDRTNPFLQIVLGSKIRGPHSRIHLRDGRSDEEGQNECWPHVRLTAWHLDQGTWQLNLMIHHALYDGVTLPSLMHKLSCLIEGTEVAKPEGSIRPWKSFIAHHRAPATIKQRRAFWTKYLSGGPHPTPQPAIDAFENRIAYLRRSAVVGMSDVSADCARNGIGLPALFFAAVAQGLNARRTTNNDHVIFGIYYSNRTQEDESAQTTCPTLNLFPVKVAIHGSLLLMDIARQIQQDLHHITSSVNSTVGLWEIKDWTGVEIDVFVNFLSLPKVLPSVLLQEVVDDQRFDEVDVISTHTPSEDLNLKFPWLKDNAVLDAFPAAIDIEASVQGDAVDIGVFGSGERTTRKEAQALVDSIGKVMASGSRQSSGNNGV